MALDSWSSLEILHRATVNLHLTSRCNFACKFCFAHYRGVPQLGRSSWLRIVQDLAASGVKKINFAGGEPFLVPFLGDLIRAAREAGTLTSVVTNGSLLKQEWFDEHCHNLDILAVSADSFQERILLELGRGRPGHLAKLLEFLQYINNQRAKGAYIPYLKLNIVVTRRNLFDDPSEGVLLIRPDRVKVLQFCKIVGENDEAAKDLAVSSGEFELFLRRLRRRLLVAPEIAIVGESEADLRDSYLVVGPDGAFRDKRAGQNEVGLSLATAPLAQALASVYSKADLGAIIANMEKRKGIYDPKASMVTPLRAGTS